jgi:hypothetical protein
VLALLPVARSTRQMLLVILDMLASGSLPASRTRSVACVLLAPQRQLPSPPVKEGLCV